jgi:CheY-like chemotaxis protein
VPRKILLADDSVTAQNMGKKILSDAGYEVITVSNGSAALKKALELLPDIAVLDVYMPGYSGLEVCKQLKENPKTAEIPILLTVGKLEPFKSEEALKAKANAFIVKPFEATELLAVIRKIEDANFKAERKPAKVAAKVSAPAKVFDSPSSELDAPDPDAEIEVGGWKNRLSMPSKRKAEPEPAEDAEAMGTGFRDLTPAPAEESGLRRESAFTADEVAAQAPETTEGSAAPATTPASLDISISPEEIAAIKAAVEILSGQGDKAPVVHVGTPRAEGMPRRLAPEPEESSEDAPAGKVLEKVQTPDAPKVVAEAALVAAVAVPKTAPIERAVKAAATKESEISAAAAVSPSHSSSPQPISAPPSLTHWKAEPVELTPAETEVSLEREMREALHASSAGASATEKFNTESLRESTEIAVPAVVLKNEEPPAATTQEVAAASDPATVLAVAASASGDSNAVSSSGVATSFAETTVAEIPSAQSVAAAEVFASAGSAAADIPAPAPASVSAGFQDMRTEASVAAAPAEEAISSQSPAPSIATKINPSAPEDEIDSRTKSQMDAAWSNWRDIRNTIVTPKLTEEIAEVVAASANGSSVDEPENSGTEAHDASSIGNIVDSVLAEMRPKLMEEIARKLASKKQ